MGTDFGRLFQMQNLGNSVKFIFSHEPQQNISLISQLKYCKTLCEPHRTLLTKSFSF